MSEQDPAIPYGLVYPSIDDGDPEPTDNGSRPEDGPQVDANDQELSQDPGSAYDDQGRAVSA